MKRKILILIVANLFLACQSEQELSLFSDDTSCGCVQELGNKFPYDEQICANELHNCQDLFYRPEIKEFLKGTQPIYLVNTSRTKTYDATIQIDNSGKVEYRKFFISPTDTIHIGCNRVLNVTIEKRKSGAFGLFDKDCEDILHLDSKSDFELKYNIHNSVITHEF